VALAGVTLKDDEWETGLGKEAASRNEQSRLILKHE